MPRKARIKLENGIYHIMCRSISEVTLFKGEKDKTQYMRLLKKYKDMHDFKLYAYCLMGNHVHLMMDANGADISKVMHGINLSYAKYFNRKHRRHGHLFQGRFKSKLVKDEAYMKQLAIYIHRNPKDFKQYKNRLEKYKFSSLSVYLGLKEDKFDILDTGVVLPLFGCNAKTARENHYKMVSKDSENDMVFDFSDEGTEYVSCRKPLIRNLDEKLLINKVCNFLKVDKMKIHLKYNRKATLVRTVVVTALRKFGGKSDREICSIIGDVTQSRISQICHEGLKLIDDNREVRDVFKSLVGLS